MKLLASLIGVSIAVAVVAGCGDAGIPSTSTPAPPTATPAPTGMRIGSWELLPEFEGGAYSSIAIQTESVRGDSAVLRITCIPESGTFVIVAFLDPFLTLAGPHEVRVSTGNSFESQVWDLLDSRRVFIPSDLFDHAGILSDLEDAQEYQFIADLEIDPERWTSFDVTGFREAEHQISPCDEGKATLVTGAGNPTILGATTVPTAIITTMPTSTLTPTATTKPTVVPVPTATPAPDGSLPENWNLSRSRGGIAGGRPFVAVRKWSADGNTGARLGIQCSGSDGFFVYVRYIEPFFSIVSGAYSVRVTKDGLAKIEEWYLSDGGDTLISLDTENTLENMVEVSQLEVRVVVGLESRWSKFDLSGIRQALPQVHPCDDGRTDEPQGNTSAGSTSNLPVPLGESGVLNNGPEDHWEITVLNVVDDAREMVDYTFSGAIKNDPPEQSQFYLVGLRVTYLGEDEKYINVSSRISAWGDTGGSYSPIFDRCGNIPNPFPRYADLSPGDILEGNVCWEIDAEDADYLLLRFNPDVIDLILDTAEPIWFALAP